MAHPVMVPQPGGDVADPGTGTSTEWIYSIYGMSPPFLDIHLVIVQLQLAIV